MISAAIERCAGIDVHKKFLAVCVMVGPLEGEPRIEKRRYGTTVAELNDLREWLQSQGVTHVVTESTGSYWKPVFNVLEEAVEDVAILAADFPDASLATQQLHNGE